MQACTIISKRCFIALLAVMVHLTPVHAQEEPPPAPLPKKEDPTLFDQHSPYLDYADFSMDEEEHEDSIYFQYGRFFAMSLGLGYQTATGNRGRLYEAAFPRFDVRLQYWFGFQFAVDLGLFFANHQYTSGGLVTQVKMIGYSSHLKYYFDVRDAAAPITFANPFLEFGAGAMSKSETDAQDTVADADSTFTVSLGGGLEFPIAHKKTYVSLEFLYHTQGFLDTAEDQFATTRGIPDLSGGFMTLMAHLMFVW